jgi:phosphoenolpyruvate-protein kinase (PTS system EI component)
MAESLRPLGAHKPETAEGVALELMEIIFMSEVAKPTREDILNTYSQCLQAARGEHRPLEARPAGIVAAALSEDA